MKIDLKTNCLWRRGVEFLTEELSPMEFDRLLGRVHELIGYIPGFYAGLELQ